MKQDELLWVVDCQNDFMNVDGKLYVPGAQEIKNNIKSLVSEHEENGGSVIFTQDWHYHNSDELSDDPDFINTFPEHCMAGTIGADLIDELPNSFDNIINWDQKMKHRLSMRPFKILLRKDKFDFIEGNYNSMFLLEILKEEFEVVNVIGVSGNVCVDYAVKGLLKEKFEVKVIMNCIASLPNIPSCDKNWKRIGVKMI